MPPPRIRSIYAEHYIKHSYRAKRTPRVSRPWRPVAIAWAGPAAFMRDRWYPRDAWYKARIQRPELIPKLHVIDPDRIQQTLEERLQVTREKSTDIGFKPRNAKANVPHSAEGKDNVGSGEPGAIDLSRLQFDQLSIADHYNIFDDLFMPGVYFHNTQQISVRYGDRSVAVGMGNPICASQTVAPPEVTIEQIQNSDAYSTLVMVNLEGSPFDEPSLQAVEPAPNSTQLVHWIVSNIPNATGNAEHGKVVVPYLHPLPFHGTGYHRVAFLVFRHKAPLDLQQFALKGDHIADRKFSTSAFFKSMENEITPSALRFFQVKWHECVDKALHDIGLKSPRFWYDWNEELKPEQKEYPMKPMPFDLYLDMYRSPESVRKDLERKKLERLVREDELQPTKYPDILWSHNRKTLPPWIHQRKMRENLGQGVYAKLYNDYANPAEQHLAVQQTEAEAASKRAEAQAD